MKAVPWAGSCTVSDHLTQLSKTRLRPGIAVSSLTLEQQASRVVVKLTVPGVSSPVFLKSSLIKSSQVLAKML